jgi:hypothetical protein
MSVKFDEKTKPMQKMLFFLEENEIPTSLQERLKQ